MFIGNVRLGLATNSSSTHSILIAPTLDAFRERDSGEFGWEDFLLTSKEDKMRYMMATLKSNLESLVPNEYAHHVASGLMGSEVGKDFYVDHQSRIDLPVGYASWYVNKINEEFFRELTDYIVNSDVAIAGGNDNEDGMDYGGERDGIASSLPKDYRGQLVARKDGEHWVLFNRETGAKVRFSFTSKNEYTKSSRPELVDLKVTSFCPFKCSHCFMDSTVSGTHSLVWKECLQVLSRMEVFEVAYGGGEPTMHPEFDKMLSEAKLLGIVPNFTTKTLRWTKDSVIERSVLENAGGFAVSVQSSYDPVIDEVCKWRDRNNHWDEVSIQAVLGVLDTKDILTLIEKCLDKDLRRITLLGFKHVGRGKDKEPKPVDILPVINKAKECWINLGLDTLAVQQYKDILDAEKIPEALRTTAEGKFSMYIDAVDMCISPSSYSDVRVPFTTNHYNNKASDDLSNVIEDEYKRW